ncbi:MAG: ABC transporter permease [Ignisphaera sp.]|nr:ABC transporter permease [Ignisphaera sp.]MCX8167540.1 ABC transporter permease [Ignisphaera sp.]MDW8086008.1 ABC transporter permease [Ignisphaera sp.]
MNIPNLIEAEFKLVYGEIFRRRSALVSMIIYPYLFAGFTLFFGYTIGSPGLFMERVGVEPVVFMITASNMVMSIINTVDDVLWRPLHDAYVGTLPYIIASPINKLELFIIIPVPRLLLLLITGFTSIVPIYVLHYGLNGVVLALTVISLTTFGALTMSTLGIIIAGLVHTVGESWRILNVVRPLLMILVGAYFPRALMPFAAYITSMFIPSSHVVESIHRILLGDIGDVYLLLALAATLALVYAPGGSRSLLYWEKKKVSEGVKTS